MAAPAPRMKYLGLALLIAGVAALLLYGSRKDGALPLATIATEPEIQSGLPQMPETLNRPLFDRRGDELHPASWRVTTLSTIQDLLSLKRGIAPDFAHEITTLVANATETNPSSTFVLPRLRDSRKRPYPHQNCRWLSANCPCLKARFSSNSRPDRRRHTTLNSLIRLSQRTTL